MKYLALALILLATPALAEIVKNSSIRESSSIKNNMITEDMVRAYYADQVNYLKGTHADYLAFARRGFHDNYKSEQSIVITIEGQPPQPPTTLVKGKQDLLAMDEATHEIARNGKIHNEVRKIDIDPTSNTARVVDYTQLTLTVDRDDGQKVIAETTTQCNDVLVVNEGQVQMLESKCEGTTNVKPGQ